MKVRLVSAQPWISESSVALDKLPAIVGRSAQADVRLDDQWISRIHCEISELSGKLIVRDLESRNGSWLTASTSKKRTCCLETD